MQLVLAGLYMVNYPWGRTSSLVPLHRAWSKVVSSVFLTYETWCLYVIKRLNKHFCIHFEPEFRLLVSYLDRSLFEANDRSFLVPNLWCLCEPTKVSGWVPLWSSDSVMADSSRELPFDVLLSNNNIVIMSSNACFICFFIRHVITWTFILRVPSLTFNMSLKTFTKQNKRQCQVGMSFYYLHSAFV